MANNFTPRYILRVRARGPDSPGSGPVSGAAFSGLPRRGLLKAPTRVTAGTSSNRVFGKRRVHNATVVGSLRFNDNGGTTAYITRGEQRLDWQLTPEDITNITPDAQVAGFGRQGCSHREHDCR